MKVSIDWLKELVDLKTTVDEVVSLLPLRTIGTKEVTDDFIELDMKGYNRADLLSMRGVAFEITAITDSKLKFEKTLSGEPNHVYDTSVPELDVRVDNKSLSPVYTLAKIEGLKIGPSPKEWVKKLEDCGMRSINNLTDITNLVMLEYGQPMHAFNAATAKNGKIIVRNAKKGEHLVTLDGKTRQLETTDLLIASEDGILGLAGVMGGKYSEIPDSGEVTILLEAAIFDPIAIRVTANRVGLNSEASKRFQHGLTKENLVRALNKAVGMYQELGGKLVGLTLDIDGDKDTGFDKLVKVPLRFNKTKQLIGVELTPEEIEGFLLKLNCLPDDKKKVDDEIEWLVKIPYFRLDLKIEEDLIEEVARMYGFENIKPKKPTGEMPKVIDQTKFRLRSDLRKKLKEIGLTEVQTYSYYSTKVLNALGFEPDNLKALIKLANPMSKETEYLRLDIWPNLLEVAANNLKTRKDIAIFEIGKTYHPNDMSGELPKEEYHLGILISNGGNNPISETYQTAQKLFTELGIAVEIKPSPVYKEVSHLFHPKRFLSITKNGEPIGGISEVHLRINDKLGIKQRVCVLGLNLTTLIKD